MQKTSENPPNITVKLTKEDLLMFNEYPDVLTLVDVCEVLRIGKNQALKLLNTGKY